MTSIPATRHYLITLWPQALAKCPYFIILWLLRPSPITAATTNHPTQSSYWLIMNYFSIICIDYTCLIDRLREHTHYYR